MAKKRSKRASKTSPARSKRRGRARAAAAEAKPKGVVNAWEQDPGDGAQPSGGQVIQRPVPVLREQPFSIRIVNPASAPEAKPHSPGTADFRYWTAAEGLRRGADFWGALLPGTSWEVGSILPVDLDFGIDLNAFYDREGLKFFHGSAAGRTVFSGESPDVVCHELGHAILDSLKPQLFDAASIEVAAFHESFGDMSAILSALQLPSLREGGDRRCAAPRFATVTVGGTARLGHQAIGSFRGRGRLLAQCSEYLLLPRSRHASDHGAGDGAQFGAALLLARLHRRVLRRTRRHAGHEGYEERGCAPAGQPRYRCDSGRRHPRRVRCSYLFQPGCRDHARCCRHPILGARLRGAAPKRVRPSRYLGAIDGGGRDARASARGGHRRKHGIDDAAEAATFGGRVWPRCPFHRGFCRGRAEAPRGCRRRACRRAGVRAGPGSSR